MNGNTFIETIRPFLTFYKHLNTYAQTTKDISSEAKKFRDVIAHATDPEATFFEQLPEAFTNEQFLRLRQRQGRRGDGKSTLRVWKSRGYIAFDEVSGMWQKRNSVSALQGEICR